MVKCKFVDLNPLVYFKVYIKLHLQLIFVQVHNNGLSYFLVSGLPMGDPSRGIRPFSSVPTLPLGINLPHMALSTSTGAIIHGSHKPIAITTPQPHNPPANSKSQSVSDTTVGVTLANHVISCTSNQGYASYSNSMNSMARHQQHENISMEKLGAEYAKIKEQASERYLLQNTDMYPVQMMNSQNIMHADILNGFSCTQCTKTFKTKAAMKLHMTVHKTQEERQYGCQVCGRRFLHRHHLVVHQRKHSGEKPFECSACKKTFMAIFLLHKHLRKHSRETGETSEIAIEQLRQLQEQKLINPGPQPLTYKNLPPTAVAGRGNGEHFVVVSDEENAGIEGKGKQIAPDAAAVNHHVPVTKVARRRNDSRSDTDKDHNGIVQKILSEAVAEIESEKQAKRLQSVKKKAETSVVAKSQGKLVESVQPLSSSTSSEQIHVKKSADQVIKKETIETETDSIKSETLEQTVLEMVPKTEREISPPVVENPFPPYSSDDEVELDVVTGELVIVGKKCKQKDEKKEEDVDDMTWPDMIDEEEEDSTVSKSAMSVDVKNEPVDNKVGSEESVVKEERDDKVENDMETEEAANCASVRSDVDDCNELKIDETSREGIIEDAENDESRSMPALSCDSDELQLKVEVEDTEDDVRVSKMHIEDIGKDVNSVIDEIKSRIEMDSNEIPVLEREGDEVVEKTSVCSSKSSDNIFERMYENVNHLRSPLNEGFKCKKGKKKGRKVKCEICSRSFHSTHYLILHMAVHKRNPMLQSLKKAKANQMKVLGFFNKTNVSCEVCNKVFKFQKSLNSHMRVHSEKLIERKLYRKAFRDFVSGKPTNKASKSAAEKKARVKSADESHFEKPAELDKPPMVVQSQSLNESDVTAMDDHEDDEPPIRIVIGEDSVKRYVCHACDNTYTTKQKLRYHALIHKDSCFLCDLCGKSFFRQITLDKHILTHKLPRPHICDICKKSFIHRSSLMRHKTAHMKPVVPTLKQQSADLNFELKMKDTYSMLVEEQSLKQKQGINHSMIFPGGLKYNPLDLTLRIKPDEQCLPPVLSPANIPNSAQTNPCNLSPPLITEMSTLDGSYESVEEFKNSIESMTLLQKVKQAVKRKPRTESGCSESDVFSNDGTPSGVKKIRKTRVYQTSCRVCKEVFPNVMLLKSHMVVHNTVETHLYECHICQHRFTQSCSLLRHLKTSCQENRMKCEPCNKTFHRRNTFEQHMRLHQGGAPNLDGSFYDKRRDEAEIREERESDVENNNSSKLQEPVITPLTIENVTLFDKENNQLMKVVDDGNDSDSDARTYLYSEGEVHSKNSDLSENDATPRRYNVPQDLTKNNMTLNLLSAVCSDIMNAEKEEEAKRLEQEEKQKELETIEILANLKRGTMQKSSPFDPQAKTADTSEKSPNIKLPSQLLQSNYIAASLSVSSTSNTITKGMTLDEAKKCSLNDLVRPGTSKMQNASISQDQHTGLNLLASQSSPAVSGSQIVSMTSASGPQNPSPRLPMKSPPPPPFFHPQSKINSIIDTAITQAVKSPAIPTVVHEKVHKDKVKRSQGPVQGHPPTSKAHITSTESSNPSNFPPMPMTMAAHPAFPQRLPFMSRDISLMHDLNSKMQQAAIQERLHMLMKAQSTQAMSLPHNLPLSALSASQLQMSMANPLTSKQFDPSTVPAAYPHQFPPHLLQQQTVPPTSQASSYDTPQDLSVKRPSSSSSSSRSAEKSADSSHYERPKSSTPRLNQKSHRSQELQRSHSKPEGDYIHSQQGPSIPMTKAEVEQFFRSRAELETKAQALASSHAGLLGFDPSVVMGSGGMPPPLVNMYQCELCSTVVYNKLDHQLHMVEHAKMSGLGVLSSYRGNKPTPLKTEATAKDSPLGEKLIYNYNCK